LLLAPPGVSDYGYASTITADLPDPVHHYTIPVPRFTNMLEERGAMSRVATPPSRLYQRGKRIA
jgi:hypothetical protein